MKKSLIIFCTLLLLFGLVACGEHQHAFPETWESDETNHWHQCSCGEKDTVAAHADETKDGFCDVCGHEMPEPEPHQHVFSETWKSDETNHWHKCSCGEKGNVAVHTDETKDGFCDVCGHEMPKPEPPVPKEEGKCTFYLTLSDSSCSIPDYGSIYLTGDAINWKTGYEALELKKLVGDNDIYYVQVANDAFDATKGTGYQVVIGYNSVAKLPDIASGLQWAAGRKSDECVAVGEESNPAFTYNTGDLCVDLGTHTWSNPLAKPAESLKNYKFVVNFEEAIPNNASVLIFGSFDGWMIPIGDTAAQCASAHKMTPSADRKTWTFNNAELVPGSYECKILVEFDTNVTSGTITWNAVSETQENYGFTVDQTDGDGYELDILGGKAHFTLVDPE